MYLKKKKKKYHISVKMDELEKKFFQFLGFLFIVNYIGLIGYLIVDLIMLLSIDNNYIILCDTSIRIWVIIEFILLILMVISPPLSIYLLFLGKKEFFQIGIFGFFLFYIFGIIFNFSLDYIDELQNPTSCSLNLQKSLNNSKKYIFYPNLSDFETNEQIQLLVEKNCPIGDLPRKICYFLAFLIIFLTSLKFLIQYFFGKKKK